MLLRKLILQVLIIIWVIRIIISDRLRNRITSSIFLSYCCGDHLRGRRGERYSFLFSIFIEQGGQLIIFLRIGGGYESSERFQEDGFLPVCEGIIDVAGAFEAIERVFLEEPEDCGDEIGVLVEGA